MQAGTCTRTRVIAADGQTVIKAELDAPADDLGFGQHLQGGVDPEGLTLTSDDTWVQWMLEWNATPGRHTIDVRATDKNGDVQTADTASPRPNGATGHHRVRVDVR